MLYPEINKLRDAAGNRYFLVQMASKRARDIIGGEHEKLNEYIETSKPVSIAAEEIADGLFSYHYVEEVEEEAEETEAEDLEPEAEADAEAEEYAEEEAEEEEAPEAEAE